MNTFFTTRRPRPAICATTLAICVLSAAPLVAATQTWTGDALTGSWSESGNWSLAVPVTGDRVIFGPVVPGAFTETRVDSELSIRLLKFNESAPSFTTTISPGATLRLQGGAGVSNLSGTTQFLTNEGGTASNTAGGTTHFQKTTSDDLVIVNQAGLDNSGSLGGQTIYRGKADTVGGISADAGTSTILNKGGNGAFGGGTLFDGAANASLSTIINEGARSATIDFAIVPPAGTTTFAGESGAGFSSVTNKGGAVDGADGGVTFFVENASAQTSIIANQGGETTGAFGGATIFLSQATAANSTITNGGSSEAGVFGGYTEFAHESTAGGSTIVNEGASGAHGKGGGTAFYDLASAGSSVITSAGATAAGRGGVVEFRNQSTAGESSITATGGSADGAKGGRVVFAGRSTAGEATLVAEGGSNGGEGGTIYFKGNATGDDARVIVNEGGVLDISGSNAAVAIRSIEGAGDIALGDRVLLTGYDHYDSEGNFLGVTNTTISGRITDGGEDGGALGNLIKAGAGTLTLTGASTYGGATLLADGLLTLEGSIAKSAFIGLEFTASLLLAGEENTGEGRIGDEAFLQLNTTGVFGLDTTVSLIDETVGGLGVLSNAVIDFGLGTAGGILRFGLGDTEWEGKLAIRNWSGSVEGGGLDQISFAGLTAAQLNQITFYDEEGHSLGRAQFLEGGFGEIVPTGVPEPGTLLTAGFLLGLIGLGRPRVARRS